MKNYKKIIAVVIIAVVLIAALVYFVKNLPQSKPMPANNNSSGQSAAVSATPTPSATQSPSQLTDPIPNALARITKKPFGIYVTPKNSPVQPERFTGYHTGVDLEVYPDEENTAVSVVAACNGPLKLKEWASGYGGVAVQACQLNGQDVTIIYGHLYINSITPSVGQQMTAGEKFAVLGQGYSQQTDGERKNLHFGTHKGTAINILGYVPNKSQLSGWLNPGDYLN